MASMGRRSRHNTQPHKGRKPTRKELHDARVEIWTEDRTCPLCGREMVVGASLNEHHLVPRSYGGTERHVMHRSCHQKIHSVFSEAELAYIYNTFEKLREHPEMVKFIKWVSKQPVESISKSRTLKTKH